MQRVTGSNRQATGNSQGRVFLAARQDVADIDMLAALSTSPSHLGPVAALHSDGSVLYSAQCSQSESAKSGRSTREPGVALAALQTVDVRRRVIR